MVTALEPNHINNRAIKSTLQSRTIKLTKTLFIIIQPKAAKKNYERFKHHLSVYQIHGEAKYQVNVFSFVNK